MKTVFFCLFAALSLTSHAQTYSVITYNIRFDNGHDGEDNWVNRKQKVADILRTNQPDVIGLQEVLNNQLDYLKKELPQYNAVGVGRDNGKTKGEYSPIFYKNDKFTLVDKGWFWLAEECTKPNKGWDAACKRICTWVVLRDTITKQEFAVFNTHLDHKGKEARKNSITAIGDSIASVCAKHITTDSAGKLVFLPVITTGDFNFTPNDENYSRFAVMPADSAMYKTGTPIFPDRSTSPATGVEYIPALQFIKARPRQDSYTQAATTEGTVGTANAFRLDGEYKNRIDYVWVTDFTVDSYRTLNDKLPNGHWPSDHFAVLVKLSLLKQ